jgi:hypothetical protein
VDEFVKVMVLDNDFEAQLVDSILNDRGIPHRMRSYHDTAYDGLFQTQKGWGHVSAPERFSQEIREVIYELRERAGASDARGNGAEE